MNNWVKTPKLIDGKEVVVLSIPEGFHIEFVDLPRKPENSPNVIFRSKTILVLNDNNNAAVPA